MAEVPGGFDEQRQRGAEYGGRGWSTEEKPAHWGLVASVSTLACPLGEGKQSEAFGQGVER